MRTPTVVIRMLACLMIALPLLLTAGAARAQAEPKFAFGKAEEVKEVKKVEWTAQVKGGAIATTGNSQSETGTLSATVSRKEGNNKLAIEGAVAYGRSNIRTPVLAAPDPTMPAMPPTIVGLERREVTTTNNWVVKGRYDRFFTLNNAGYLSAQSAADPLAGKAFTGGGQLGYSRQLVNTGMHLLVAEVGYDLSHERYVQQPGKTLDPVTIHSARFFVKDTMKVTDATGATASVEAFFNLNEEGKALNVNTGTPGVDPFKDTRVIGKLGLTTTLRKRLSIAFGFTIRYDQNPAPLPVPSGSPAGTVFATAFLPFAQSFDTMGEATLIYTFM